MADHPLDLPGFQRAWGHAIWQCPYCHGWEAKGQRWGYLALDLKALDHGFPELLRGWTDDVVVFNGATLDVPRAVLEKWKHKGVRYEPKPVSELIVEGKTLTHIALEDGSQVPCRVLYAHPPQTQVPVVSQLNLELDEQGFVRVDPMTRQTSMPGVYAAGDLTTRAQAAVAAAATGMQAGAMTNHDLCVA